ncbi:hypothetical protein Pth03_76390 [Planotetraspora thailandica]|uniref:Uncharacterized protein n=1 Tax=Planotetraspora thailandica TaxID=487172 RepID=A0A8J4DFD6_9ACTN|nr:hypothetical protein [Planotetraspora thailandica]GII59250.1 hypothetical protein Pth03_76390 [Planotetraspora thailandica]
MDVDDLTDALTAHTPDPQSVLVALQTKRGKRAHRRVLAAAGGAVAVAVPAILLWTAGLGAPAPDSSAAHGSAPTTAGAPEGASACATVSLQRQFAEAREGGASVILAKGTLTGRRGPHDPEFYPEVYAEMRLTDVRTLSGPAIPSGSHAWISSDHGPTGPIPGTPSGSLWAPDGSLFGIIWPQSATGEPVGPTMRVAPVVKGQLILSTAGCWRWSAEGTPTTPFSGPLAEIPGSDSYKRAAEWGFRAVPLSVVELATR